MPLINDRCVNYKSFFFGSNNEPHHQLCGFYNTFFFKFRDKLSKLKVRDINYNCVINLEGINKKKCHFKK